MKSKRKTKAVKKIRGIHNIDLIDDEIYHRSKPTYKKMKDRDSDS